MNTKQTHILRIALGQMNPIVGDLKGNYQKICRWIQQAKKNQADIIIFPELALSGYPPEDLLLKKQFITDTQAYIKKLVAKTRDITVVCGFPFMKQNLLYNAAGIITPTGIMKTYHKICLPNYSVFDEKRYFTPGNSILMFTVKGVRVSVNICEDLWDEQGPSLIHKDIGTQLLINISASPFDYKKTQQRKKLVHKRIQSLNLPIVYVNQVGGQDELVFDGSSFILSEEGKTVTQCAFCTEELSLVDLPVPCQKRITHSMIKKHGAGFPWNITCFNADKKLRKTPLLEKKQLPQQNPAKKLSREAEIYNALVLGTRDYTLKNGFKKVVLGLSGGIDSALTAAIAVDALGPDNVYAVSMPGPYSSRHSKTDAQKFAKNFNITLHTVPITHVFKTMLSVLDPVFTKTKRDITEENLQARLRGMILMALSNKFHYLVLSTGNKSEGSMGYATLYGDMVGGLCIIKDLSKTLVYRLSNYRNTSAGFDSIPQAILDKEPSAELRPNQKDSDSLPPYELLDQIIEDYIEKDYTLDKICQRRSLPKKLIKGVISQIDRNEYKRRQAPPGIKISLKAFGKDRRMPITNQYT